MARMDNRVGVDNEEQGGPVGLCHDPTGGWRDVGQRLRHLDWPPHRCCPEPRLRA
jgi:hypothetical protein